MVGLFVSRGWSRCSRARRRRGPGARRRRAALGRVVGLGADDGGRGRRLPGQGIRVRRHPARGRPPVGRRSLDPGAHLQRLPGRCLCVCRWSTSPWPPIRPAAIAPGSDRLLRFGRARTRSAFRPGCSNTGPIPAALEVQSFLDLAVSLEFADALAHQTGHPGARAVSFPRFGFMPGDVVFLAARRAEHWILLSGVDVAAAADSGAVVLCWAT